MTLNSATVAAGDAALASAWNNLRKDVITIGGEFITAGGTADALTFTVDAQIDAYTTGMKIRFKASATNTTTCTGNLNSIGAKTIKTKAGAALTAGHITNGRCYELTYDGTDLIIDAVASATNTAEGTARFATDAEVETGTSQSTIVNPYQLALYRNTPEQEIPYYVGTTATNSSNHPQVGSSATDDGVFFMAYFVTSTVTIFRFERQSIGGQYAITHTTTLNTTSTSVRPGLAVIGSYLYVCTYDATNAQMVNRYLAADLSGVTVMTLSGTNFGTVVGSAWTDGTNLYVYNGTTSQYNKYSISGTTYTFVSTITYTSAGNASQGGAMSDGTSVWIAVNASGAITFRKYPIAGGASTANKVVYIYADAYPNSGRIGLFLSRKQSIGIAHAHSFESNSAMTGCVLRVKAISTP